jgi:phospholipid/cholesterol/gamma-HCH transport system permease protein
MDLFLQIGSAITNILNEFIYVGTITGFSFIMKLCSVLISYNYDRKRVEAAIMAELGTMKITEQLNVLYMLGTNPLRFFAVSRFLACFLLLASYGNCCYNRNIQRYDSYSKSVGSFFKFILI